MTRYEWIKSASIEELASMLCDLIDNTFNNCSGSCEDCLATNYCTKEHNGFIDWLNNEATRCHGSDNIRVWD